MEDEATSLDDILGVEPTAEASEPDAVARDEQGRFASKSTGEAEAVPQAVETPPEAPPASEPSHIPLAALQDERTKRQRAEDDLRGAQARLQQYEAHFQQQPQPQPDEDPIAYITQAIREQLAPQLQQELLQNRVQMAETMARQRWSDYDAKIELFKAAAERNPFLTQQLLSAQDPASHAYNMAIQIEEAQRYNGQPVQTREQIEAEMREKILSEIGMSKTPPPLSLATERSMGSRSGPAWAGPTSLDDILRS